jgi:hypothetical protein
LKATSRLQFDSLDYPIKSEDILICHYLYDEMRAIGVRFAPPEIAALFAIESTRRLYGQSFDAVFGFHGKHWLDRAVRAQDLSKVKEVRRNDPCPCGSGKDTNTATGSSTRCAERGLGHRNGNGGRDRD